MSPTRQPLRERFRRDLRSGSLPVSLTAVPLAMITGLGSAWYWDDSGLGFTVLVLIGVFVPYAHENHWPRDRSWTRDAAWTVAASAVAGGLFAGSYLLAAALLGESIHVAVVAFVATAFCGEALSRLLRRRRT